MVPKSELPDLRRALLRWHRRHALVAPWRTSGDAYQVLVAAVMAQQTQMARVLPKFAEFIAAFPTIDALAAAATADVLRVWGGLGYNLRALRLHRAARQIARAGAFPRRAAELGRIDGVGPFTAAIVASFAFAEPAPAIDTNVRRVLARLVFGDTGGTMRDHELLPAAEALLARRAAGRWNQALMDLGGTVCAARRPRCEACPLARWCRARPAFARPARRAAEPRAAYDAGRLKPAQPDRLKPAPKAGGSRRYYRGRIVQALRELPPGRSLSVRALLERLPARDGLDRTALDGLVEALRRDGLVRVARGRVRLP